MAENKNVALQAAVDDLLDVAEALAAEKADLLARIGANRSMLRNYAGMGVTTAEQAREIADRYPPKTRKGKGE